MTILEPTPAGLPPMTLPQAVEYVNRIQMIEGRLMEILGNDPITWAASSSKAAIMLYGHCVYLETAIQDCTTVLEVGQTILQALFADEQLGPAVRAFVDEMSTQSEPQPVESLPQDRAETV